MNTAVFAVVFSPVTGIAAIEISTAFSLGAGALLLILLIIKEITLVFKNAFALRLGKYVTAGIVPLVIGFGIIIIVKLANIML